MADKLVTIAKFNDSCQANMAYSMLDTRYSILVEHRESSNETQED